MVTAPSIDAIGPQTKGQSPTITSKEAEGTWLSYNDADARSLFLQLSSSTQNLRGADDRNCDISNNRSDGDSRSGSDGVRYLRKRQ